MLQVGVVSGNHLDSEVSDLDSLIGTINLYDGVSLTEFRASDRNFNIGGAVISIFNGTLNMYGGDIYNNSTYKTGNRLTALSKVMGEFKALAMSSSTYWADPFTTTYIEVTAAR
ncbi:MAG: hypothetical protein PUJ57_04375 [Peptoniphilaceae bacterium]|nr:hypothetical protein [Peptoniphilaceae bacterium]MDY6085352.1 hypothetical protein [Peptoniphilaceae bacterium]